jgi:hypothetical protein
VNGRFFGVGQNSKRQAPNAKQIPKFNDQNIGSRRVFGISKLAIWNLFDHWDLLSGN